VNDIFQSRPRHRRGGWRAGCALSLPLGRRNHVESLTHDESKSQGSVVLQQQRATEQRKGKKDTLSSAMAARANSETSNSLERRTMSTTALCRTTSCSTVSPHLPSLATRPRPTTHDKRRRVKGAKQFAAVDPVLAWCAPNADSYRFPLGHPLAASSFEHARKRAKQLWVSTRALFGTVRTSLSYDKNDAARIRFRASYGCAAGGVLRVQHALLQGEAVLRVVGAADRPAAVVIIGWAA
jgi:hypothetical protein